MPRAGFSAGVYPRDHKLLIIKRLGRLRRLDQPAQVLVIQRLTTKTLFTKLFSLQSLKIMRYYVHESERDQDQKTNSFHESSPIQIKE